MIGLAGETVQAQTLGDLISSNAGAYYKFADPTDITIEVKVWGSVQYPGLYEVPQGTRLSTLLTLAGGPLGGSDSRTRRTYTIRHLRPQPNSGVYQAISESLMENEIVMLNDDSVLLPGDVIVAEEKVKQLFNWRDALSIATSLGTLVLVIDRVAR